MSLDLDISSLLSPFDGDSRAGTDLRLDDDPNNAYRKIRDARSDAKEEEDRANIDGETSSEAFRSWRGVWSDGQNYLQTFAKDLEIVAYMIEASIRLDGFAGLCASLQLTKELVENFWGELLPTPDEDGIETTLLPIARLNSDAISFALQRVPITDDTSVGEFVLWQYVQAKRLDGMDAEERERQVSGGAVTMDLYSRAVAESSDDFYRDLMTQLESASGAVDELDSALQEKAGEDLAPNLSRFRQSIEEARSTLRILVGDRLAVNDEASEDGSTESENASGNSTDNAGSGGGGVKGGISNRNEALDVLEKVALWFERHEPQSILISEIRKVKRRALMTPEQLYRDLIDDSTVRDQLFKDVGISTDSDE